jgi:FAS-associated factor 2
MATERKEAEQKQARDRELRLAEERRQQELEDVRNREKIRMEWRRWSRRVLTPPDAEKASKDVLKIAFRLPGDRQSRRQFPSTATLTSLYAFVDSQLIPADLSPEDDPIAPPDRKPSSDPNHTLDEHITKQCPSADDWWAFKLVFAYPRQEIKWEAGRRLSDVAVLKGGGQIMVEMIEPVGHSTNFSDEEDSDDEDS